MIGKDLTDVKLAFIPTAANAEAGNKDWFIAQLTNLQAHGYNWIDIVDPSAPELDWKARLAGVDVIFVSGGNTFYLLDQWRKTGFGNWLAKNLDNKVYVGVSAGTIIATPNITVSTIEPADKNISQLKDLTGMGWVDFEIEPHCEAERFAVIKNYAKNSAYTVYAIDDETAIQVIDREVIVVSEGHWERY